LIVIKLDQDWFPLLELLSIAFNPSNKFHSYNANRPPESYSLETPVADDELFARPTDNRLFKGKILILIN
jgi:ubiquitin carboxyl-terminal hydrolase 9/24